MFAGTRIPVRRLMDHLDRGRDLEAFLEANPELKREVALAALALGLEALLREVPLEAGPQQRSLLPRLDADGVIINAEELAVDQVVGRRVRCPGCRKLVFKSWPDGWDGHAATQCRGVQGTVPETRKAEFKRNYAQLFR